ncbi:unnamed protein product [Caenorhabditis nigoni]
MKSIISASLVALAFATTPAFECLFEPKTDYHYKFDGLVLSGLPISSTEQSQTRISARARIQSNDRDILLQLVDIQLAASHLPDSELIPEMNSLEQRELSNEYKKILELPVRAQLKNGLIYDLQFEKEDTEWSENMKRAILNMISFNPIAPRDEKLESDEDKEWTEDKTAFFTNEKTLEGNCQVAYSVVREQKKTIVTKSVNFDKCSERSETAYGLRHTSECPECDNQTEVIRPQTVYTYVLENNELKQSEVRSLYTINVNGQEVMKTETRSKLVFEESHSIKSHIKKVNGEKEDIVYSSRWEQLVEDFYKNGDKVEFSPFEKFLLDKKIQSIKTIIERIQKVENNIPETAHFLARLVCIFRTASLSQLQGIHEKIYAKAETKIQSLIESALAISGTKNTIQHLLNHMENEDITPVEGAKLIKSIQETPFPSKSIAESLLKFSQSRVAKTNEIIRQSVWLATGSVIRGVVDIRNLRPLIREDKRDMKDKFFRTFRKQFEDAETTYEKILALKTIGNAGLDISVNKLNDIIIDKRQPLPVRKEDIDALRLLKDSMPRKIQKVLLPIYKNRQYEPEIRMLALFVSQMEKESSQQVAALTYQMIRQFSQSTNPCYTRVAKDCSKVLSFTRFQPQEQMIASVYAQLPLFMHNTFSGAQFDFAAIFEKNSFLPKDLHASLDSVFGGNWNKYFAQVGISQENMDHYIYKTLQKLESLEKESTTVVRGRRIQAGIRMLKELAQKMNIRARKPTRNEKDAYAQIYLRYKDMDYAVLPIDSELVENVVERFVSSGKTQFSEIRRVLRQNSEYEAHHAAFFYEPIRKFPTTLGLPLTVSGKIPTVMSQGVKTLQSVHAYTPFEIQIDAGLTKNFELVYKVIVPQRQTLIVSLSTRPVVFLRHPGFSKFEYIEAEERTVSLPEWQQKTQEIERTENFVGLEVSTRENILRQHSVENWLLAEQDFEVTVENKNRPAEFVFRMTVSPLEKTPLSEIKINNDIIEKEFELEQERSENRRESFSKMIKNIQNEQGYKSFISFMVEAPHAYEFFTELTTICDEQVRMCQWSVRAYRSPIFAEEKKDWTLRSQLLAMRPEMPSSLRQLREQPHRENELNINAQLQQSKEQKKYERNMEREVRGMPEYELLIKAARLNQVNMVAEYKFTKENEETMSRLFNLAKAYNYWTVKSRPEDNEENRVVLQLTVEPMSRQYVNVTVQTPEGRVEMKNTQIPRVHLPSIAQRATKYQYTEASGAVCKVQKNQIRTFDNVLYKTPLTTCYSLIAKDCSEEPTFAILSKKVEKNSEEMMIKVLRGEQEIIAQLQNEEIRVKVDGKKIQSEDFADYQIERLGESAIVIELPEGEVRFDGYTIKTQLPFYSRQQQLCGLCGNNDDESTNEFMAADNTETEDMEEFHRSYLLKNEECETEEERLTEKKNYRKYERYEEESTDSDKWSDYEESEYTEKNWKSERKSQLVEKTQIKEQSHRICFSMEPVAECRRGFEPESRLTKKIRFTCMPRHSANARRLMKEARQEPLQLDDYTTSFVESVKVPTACVAY